MAVILMQIQTQTQTTTTEDHLGGHEVTGQSHHNVLPTVIRGEGGDHHPATQTPIRTPTSTQTQTAHHQLTTTKQLQAALATQPKT